jgi:ribonuclease H / adenosylcobalamin/alpha-ribazole phosphatase
VATNNVAEYRGLIAGLRAAADLGAVEVEVRMDSKLVVEQMSGRWQIKHPGLRPLAAEAAGVVGRFETVRFGWVPREENRRADALANAAMDGRPLPDLDLSSPSAPPPTAPSRPPSDPPAAGGGARGSWLPPTGTGTRLVLVRHGETELTAQRRYSGRGNVELSTVGREQARAVGRRLAGSIGPVAAVVSSPLARCVQTAEAIAETVEAVPGSVDAETGRLAVRLEPDVIECDFGEWEGLTFAEVRRRWPEEMDEWMSSPAQAPPGGESFDAVRERVSGAVSRLAAEFAGQTVVVVSHVSPIKLILRDALAATEAFLHRMFLDPAGISIVDYYTDGPIAVRTVNDTAHLPVTP